MKISLEWLNEFLPGPLDAQQLADALTHGGLPVEVIEHVGDDTVIDVEVTSNRPDCLSVIGVARELSALLNRPFALTAAQSAVPGGILRFARAARCRPALRCGTALRFPRARLHSLPCEC